MLSIPVPVVVVIAVAQVLKYGRLYASELRAGNRSQDPYTLSTETIPVPPTIFLEKIFGHL